MLGFLCTFAVAVCGLAGAPAWWCVPLASVALASVSYAKHHMLFRRAADLGLQDGIDYTIAGSLFSGLVASAAAYGCGAVLRVLSLGLQ
jgi:hypothetical protein